MDIGRNLGEAYQYAVKLFSDAGRLLVLVVLSIIPIVDFITLGYLAKVIRETPSRGEPPRLEDYGELWVEGLKIVVGLIIYAIIPAVLIGLAAGPLIAAGLFGYLGWGGFRFFAVGAGILLIIMIVVGVILAFFIAIIATMGITHMVKKKSFGKAFAFGEITAIIARVGWGSFILWVIVIYIISWIYGLVVAIPVIGWLIGLVLLPVYGTFVARSAGLVYAEATGERALPPAAEAPV